MRIKILGSVVIVGIQSFALPVIRSKRSITSAHLDSCSHLLSTQHVYYTPHLVRGELLVFIEDHERVFEHGLHHTGLHAGIAASAEAHRTAHHGGCKANGQTSDIHAVVFAVFHDAGEMQGDGADGGVVRVGEGVDDGVQGVAAGGWVFDFFETS